ncbi:MAG: hypothetical protein JGK33_00905 [Microcoleus sp. PH2017_11_PCY_U_A]|nr:hypothetical protein [Microcoleus sp. PH2017_11_PCY_U_A]MCC3476652.1 hypothetical protein [Microcoleus sp. PH2017_12_PCY_D_A]
MNHSQQIKVASMLEIAERIVGIGTPLSRCGRVRVSGSTSSGSSNVQRWISPSKESQCVYAP